MFLIQGINFENIPTDSEVERHEGQHREKEREW